MTSAHGRARLLEVIATGELGFVITAADGAVSIRAQLVPSEGMEFVYGALSVDWCRASVSSPMGRVTLSRTELRLLGALLESNGATVGDEQLIECVWPGANFERPTARVLHTHLHSLRQRLAAIGVASSLRNVRGGGYRLQP